MTSEKQRKELQRKIWCIASKDYNLSVRAYVEKKDDRQVVDIKILNAEIDVNIADLEA